VHSGRGTRFFVVSAGLVSLLVGLAATPAIATTLAGSAPPIAVTVPAAGISLQYPNGWTSLELTPTGLTNQVKTLAATDPARASIVKTRGRNLSSATKFDAFDLGAAAQGRPTGEVQVALVPAMTPNRLDRAAALVNAGYKRHGTVRVRGTRHFKIDGVPALRNDFTFTLRAKKQVPPIRVAQLFLAQKGGTWVLVTVTAENTPTGAAVTDTTLTSVHVVGRPVPGPGPLQLRPVLTALPPATSSVSASDAASAAIASCDVNQIAALPEVPTTDSPPDTCVVLPFKSGEGDGRLFLGPARLTTADLDSASSSFQTGVGYVIDMNLTKAGLVKFNHLAADLYANAPPQNQVAIVIEGKIYSNPAFESDRFSGPIQLSGSFSNSEAAALARELNYATVTR
jgi:hypothetical protein